MSFKSLLDRRFDLFAFLVLITTGFLVYANNYHVPWYFDDFANITDNQAMYLAPNLLDTLFLNRGPVILTFALNYALHGENLPGYHLVNNTIHALVAVIVYLLLKRTTSGARYWALAGALVFLTHPLQTQAVTYIVQRMTSLSALFAFTCVYCFARGREVLAEGARIKSWRHAIWYAGMLIFCALAVITKQNTAFLPIGLFVFGRYFLDKDHGWSRRRSIAYLAPFFLPPLYITYAVLIVPLMNGVTFSEIGSMGSKVSPLYYFVTEWQIIWIYLKLLFIPLGQTLDYNYPVITELLTLKTVLSGSGIACLMYAAFRRKDSQPHLSFAITWFFISLAVESTILPLDVMFEHRLYVPMFGFSVLAVRICRAMPWRPAGTGLMVAMIAVYCVLTLQRNTLWANPIAFNEDNLRKAPHNERIYVELSRLYIEHGRYPESQAMLLKALSINPRAEKAYDNLGTLYDLTGNPAKAIETYRSAIAFNPAYPKPYINMAVVYSKQGEHAIAEELLTQAATLFPDNASICYNLGVTQFQGNKRREARDSFTRAMALAPNNANAIYNLAILVAETGDFAAAIPLVTRLTAIDPNRGGALAREIQLMKNK